MSVRKLYRIIVVAFRLSQLPNTGRLLVVTSCISSSQTTASSAISGYAMGFMMTARRQFPLAMAITARVMPQDAHGYPVTCTKMHVLGRWSSGIYLAATTNAGSQRTVMIFRAGLLTIYHIQTLLR